MEFAERGASMPSKMMTDPLPLDISRSYFRDMASGVDYCMLRPVDAWISCSAHLAVHHHRILHRDIKPANLLVMADARVKVGDLGSCRILGPDESDMLRDTAGTPTFTPPEVCTAEQYSGCAADVWAMGATLYMMLFGRPPFVALNVPDLYQAIQRDPYASQLDVGLFVLTVVVSRRVEFPEKYHQLNDDLRDFLVRILDKNPSSRITMEGIRVRLPFFRLFVLQSSHRGSRSTDGSRGMAWSLCRRGMRHSRCPSLARGPL